MMNRPIKNAAGEDWYRDKRQPVEAFFVESNLVPNSEKTYASPSGKYRLVVNNYRTKEGCWQYSRGSVFCGDHQIADVKRNYSTFHFGWAEGHPNGHDYLLCGEDYQGQTVIELDTGKRVDFISESGRGGGFCCAAYYPSPDGRLIVIDGCVWAAPYELLFYSFDDPMTLPWPMIDRAELNGEAQGWTDEGFVYESSEDIRTTDLSEAEQDDLWKQWNEIGGHRIQRHIRKADGSKVFLDERIVPNKATENPSTSQPRWLTTVDS